MNSKSDHDDAVSTKVQRSCSFLNYSIIMHSHCLSIYKRQCQKILKFEWSSISNENQKEGLKLFVKWGYNKVKYYLTHCFLNFNLIIIKLVDQRLDTSLQNVIFCLEIHHFVKYRSSNFDSTRILIFLSPPLNIERR